MTQTFPEGLFTVGVYIFQGAHSRLGIFLPVDIQVVVFWVVTPCSDVIGHKSFRYPLHHYTVS